MDRPLRIDNYIAAHAASPLAAFGLAAPWEFTTRAEALVRQLLQGLDPAAFRIDGEVAVHRSATVEPGAVLKGPLVLGARVQVAAGAYLRGGNWLDADCVVGPGSELKSSFVHAGSRFAHFNFVGDALVGADVNFEAGSVLCNYRNERGGSLLRLRAEPGEAWRETGVAKFGGLIGDGCRIGANAVLAPATLLGPSSVVARGASIDQDP